MNDTATTESSVPDESTIRWAARLIDGVWCVGMDGNLDTLHDAALRITGGWLSPDAARVVAEAVAAQHNAAIDAAGPTIQAPVVADDVVTLSFVNRSAAGYGHPNPNHELRVDRAATAPIAEWYGGYCGGDDYDVLIDGEIVEKDIDGRIR